MIPLRLAPASAMLMLLAACGSPDTTNPDTAPVPLPRAWPRTLEEKDREEFTRLKVIKKGKKG